MRAIFEEEPGLKLIVPRTGGIVPYLRGKLERMIDVWTPDEGGHRLSQPAQDSFWRPGCAGIPIVLWGNQPEP